ncbi:hypothetical protein [Peptoniphilus phoceensis]|uniref:hypothetical protein n=1 Tax=Peptoniphilus phoceensis TaxID=1720298 RepID=UPI000780D3CB|nr:hypothetical protein [Peptoniphilus phoceensis]
MGGVIFVLAIVVIVCFIYWKKSQNKRIPEGKKSIEKVNEANNSKRENLHKTSDNSNGLSNNEDLERKNKKEVYDASRKKDRGKKRREKKKSNEIKSEVKAQEVKEEKAKADESKKETKIENQDIDVKVSHEADKVKEDAQASKENSETKTKDLKKENQVKAKEVKEEKITKSQEVKEEKVKEDAQASKENSEDLGKNLKKENQVKTEKIKEEKITKSQEVKEEKTKADESKKETRLYNQDIDVKVSHEADKVKEDAQASKENSETKTKNLKEENQVKAEEVKEEKFKTEEIKEEKISEPEEIKREKENLKITNEKYSDLISSLKNNPWKKEDLNTKVKLENTRTKKTISEEEIDNLPLEKIKSSLSPESVSEFLNAVKTNPTILKRKDDTAYEFTSKDKDEIELIKKRYNLLDRDIDKITSVLIFDKDNLKVKEVKDILAEGKNRIYMETKF